MAFLRQCQRAMLQSTRASRDARDLDWAADQELIEAFQSTRASRDARDV
jgi:hypothetical protein